LSAAAKGATVALQMNLSLDGLAFLTRPFFAPSRGGAGALNG